MKIENVPCTKINWDSIPISKHPGESGNAYWRMIELGNIRIRLAEYSPGYRGGHWCCRGHVIHMLEGEMVFEMKDGSRNILKKGMTWCVSDNDQNPHQSFTKNGAQLFIVD
jgi:uncharacterized cupin superfamily protein